MGAGRVHVHSGVTTLPAATCTHIARAWVPTCMLISPARCAAAESCPRGAVQLAIYGTPVAQGGLASARFNCLHLRRAVELPAVKVVARAYALVARDPRAARAKVVEHGVRQPERLLGAFRVGLWIHSGGASKSRLSFQDAQAQNKPTARDRRDRRQPPVAAAFSVQRCTSYLPPT